MNGITLGPTSPLADQYRRDTVMRTGLGILQAQEQARTQRALQTLSLARQGGIAPEQAVRGQQLATTALGSPSFRLLDPTVMDSIEAKVKLNRETEMLTNHPRTAEWATDYNNALAAHDDIENVGVFESVGRAVSKRTDAIFDNTITSVVEGFHRNVLEWARNTQKTFGDLLAAKEAVVGEQAKEKAKTGDSFTDALTRLTPGGLAVVKLAETPEAQALGAWLLSRVPLGEEDADILAKDAEKGIDTALADRAFEAREREGFWPTPGWRQEIERQIAEIDGNDAAASLIGMFGVFKRNPARSLQYLFEVGAESGLSIAAGATAAFVTKSPAAAATVMGVSSYVVESELYFDELIQQYGHDISTVEGRKAFLADPRTALELRDKAKARAIVIGLLDGASGGLASKTLVANPVGNMVVQMLAQSALGGGGEALGALAAGEQIDWNEVILEALAETVTAPVEVGGMALSGTQKKIAAMQRATDAKRTFEILSGTAEVSKLRARDVERYAAAIKHVTENGPAENVYVDPAQFEEMFQGENAKITLEEFFNNVPDLDIRLFQEARDNGSQFAIPTGVYAAYVAGSDLDVAMREHIKFDPNDMSAFEAKTFAEDLKATQAKLAENTAEIDSIVGRLDGPLAAETERLTSEIISAQGITTSAATNIASVLVASARAGAQRAGLTTAEYLRRYTLPTIRNSQDVGPAKPAGVNVDAVMDYLAGEPGVEALPDMAIIADEIERRGMTPDTVSRAAVAEVVRDLVKTGALTAEVPLEVQARPATVAKPTGEEFMQTATLRGGQEDLSQWGIDPSRKNTVRDIALKMQARQRKLYGKTSRKQRGQKTIDKFGEWMADEIEFELQTPGDAAKGWYTTKYQKALDRLAIEFPEFTTGRSNLPGLKNVKTAEDARAIFTAILAITSNGMKAVDNFRMAVQLYSEYRMTGRTSVPRGAKDRVASMVSSVNRLQQLLAEFGSPSEVRDFLLEEVTVSEVNKQLVAMGLPKMGKVPASMRVPRAAAIFGPKIGAFYANLSGSTGYPTMDLWWTRTINRYRGDVLPRVTGLNNEVDSKGQPVGLNRFKHMIGRPDLTDSQALNYVTEYAQRYIDKGFKDGTEAEKAANTLYKAAFTQLADAPEGAADRAFMLEVARAAQRKVAERTGEWYSIADIQALIWYYEKRLYAEMGVRDSGDVSYEEAAAIALDGYRRASVAFARSTDTFNQGPVDPAKNTVKEGTIQGPDGRPVRLFHGTNQQFDAFKSGRIFLTNRRSLAVEHALRAGTTGARVVEANVALQNPLEVQAPSGVEPDIHWLNNTISIEEQVRAGGHDSVMIWNPEGDLMVIATSNDQITQIEPPKKDSIFFQGPTRDADERLPGLEKASPGRVVGVRELATEYMRANGLPVRHQAVYAEVDTEVAALIARLYDKMEHAPNDPEVKAAYDALAKETIAQYEFLLKLGMTFDWITGKDPYKTPADAIRDMQENNHLWVFPTDAGFGSLTEAEADNPLLAPTPYVINGKRAVVNDLFRIVHDVFGHGSEGASFGARGEENAWQAHVRMFTPLAARAMTTETRGQNSWVNFGPYGEQNRANPKKTVFADQKTGLLPEWVSRVRQVEDVPIPRPASDGALLSDFKVDKIDNLTLEAFQRPGWFIVSAKSDAHGAADSEGNLARAQELRDKLAAEGLEYLELRGTYAGTSDGPSFLVIGSEEQARALGHLYQQESVLTKDGLIYTDGSDKPNVPFVGLKVGWDASHEDYFSHIEGMAPNANFSLDLKFPDPNQYAYGENGATTHYGAEVVLGERGTPMIEMVHWSTRHQDGLSPKHAGTGPLRGPELKRNGPDKVFFGINQNLPSGYKRESYSLGRFKHYARVPAAHMYPWWQDPDGLRAMIPSDTPPAQEAGVYEELIKGEGYDGYFVIGGPLGDVAVTFHAMTPERVDVENDAPIKHGPEFDAWFGKSVVTNTDGTPRLQFHATNVSADFGIFKPVSHFGTLRAAEQRLNVDRRRFDERSRVIPAYLRIENPLRIEEEFSTPWQRDQDVLDTVVLKLEEVGQQSEADALFHLIGEGTDAKDWTNDYIAYMQRTLTPEEFAERPQPVSGLSFRVMDRNRGFDLYSEFIDAVVMPQVIDVIKAAGYDGFVYKNMVEDVGIDSYIALEPQQVKSPWNKGVWSTESGDLLEQTNRGSIVLPADGSQATISVMDGKADLSTILHETGHFFLWQLQRMKDDGLEFAARDYEVVRGWWKRHGAEIAAEAGVDEAQVQEYLEVGTTGLSDVDAAIHRALHEQFARGFEKYAFEGKSPSNAMRSIFESFAAWLLAIYRSAKGLNVDIDNDVRGVFDRMLATEEEITTAADREAIDTGIAETARAMGLDEDSYRRLVLLSEEARDEGRQIARAEMLKAERQMRSLQYQARLAEIDGEEREIVNSRPVNRAIQWLGYGRWLGGQAPQEMPLELRLDTDILVEEHGSEIVKRLPRGRRPVHMKGTGLSADEVAGWFGFNSGAEMLDAMVKAPKANDEIRSRVEARAREELGDIMGKPGEVEEAMLDAFHGEKQGQVIVAELRAINRISGGKSRRITTRAMASHIARETMAKMPVREAMMSHRYQAAERKHAEDAARLLATGDVEGAFDAKRKQLIQHALYSESRKVTELVGKAERLAGRLKKKSTRENLAADYLGAIDDILETYNFRKVSGKAELRRDRLLAYVDMMKQSGRANELAIPDSVLKAAAPIPYKTLSVQRLQGVYDTLVNIEHTARRKQKLLDAKAERELQEVIDEIGATMTASVGEGEFNRVSTRRDKVMSEVKGYFNLVRNADTILRRLDGWLDRGPMYRYFKDAIDAASIRAVEMREKATNDLDNLFAAYGAREREQMAIRRVWSGYDQAISKWDIISIALNMGNKDNLERLTSRDSRGSLRRDQVDALVANLDKRDWDFVQSVWDYLDREYWPQIKAREERVTGVAPQKVEAMPVPTKFGEYRGGYYPIVYDSRFTATVGEDRNKDLMESMMAGRFGKAATRNGHTKERASGGGGRTLELGMHVLFGHLNHVIHDLAFGEAVGQTWALLQDKRVKSMFETAGRLEDHQALELWVQDVAAGPAAGTHALAGFLRRLKSGFTVSKLAFNLSTVAIQITGATQSASLLGSGNLIAGYSQYVASGFGLAEQVAQRSTFMRKRQETFQRDVLDMLNDTQLDPLRSKMGNVAWYVMQAGFWAMQKVQFYGVDVPTWLAAHRQGLNQGMTDEEAALHADRMVARAQASGLYADRTAVERGTMGRTARQNEFLRLFTALGSYMFAKFNVANEIVGRTARDISDAEKSSVLAILKAASDLVLLFAVEAILYNAVKGTLPGMGDDDDEDGWAAFLAKETALSVFSVFPFVRDVSSAAQGFSGGGAYGGISESVGRAVNALGDVAAGTATIGDARSANELVGILFPGYPSTAIWRLIDGAGLTGKEPSPLAAILGR